MAGLGWFAVSTIDSIVGSAVSTISDCAQSILIEKMVDMRFSFIGDRIIPDDSKSELERLQVALPQIKSLMGIAEALREKDPSFDVWFHQFRRAVNTSEDVLDELEYQKLEDMVKKRDEASGSTSRFKKHKSCCINEDTLKRLREAVTMLDQATADVEHLHKRARELGVHDLSKSLQEVNKVLKHETTSFLIETKVFGRDVEKEKNFNWLKRPTEGPLSLFGIAGMGGLGKTTLAQLAYQEVRGSTLAHLTYQEMRGLNHFDQTIWVCVSSDFTVEGLIRKIVGYGSDLPLNALQNILKEKIQSQKILLVLDDVWDDENSSSWEQLIAPLRFAQEGSKLLFTTRMKSVYNLLATVINTKHEILILEGLGEQHMQLLFNKYAFRGSNLDNHSELQVTGDQIVKMLKGSPLGAKLIGSLLNSQLNYEYWRRILKCGSLFNIDQAKNVMEVLKFSYYHLPADLQVCFRFCSIFPRDYLFKKNELIEMWIACGFICPRSCQKERLENIGEDYFNQLLGRSFFELSTQNNILFEREGYVMHDLIYELAQIVSIGECCRVALNDKSVIIPNTVQHVSIYENEIERISHLKDLRSLIIHTSKEGFSLHPDSFVLPSNLIKRTFRLIKIKTNRECKLPDKIGGLLHLRYLSVRPDYWTHSVNYIPTSVYGLYHLQVLEFSNYTPLFGSSYSGIEVTGITNLINLRHMRLLKEIIKTIRGVHKLISLEELTLFVGYESGHGINELRTLKNLRHLCIENIENVEDPNEAKCANLLGMEHLISLCLNWTSNSNSDNPEQIMDCLQPHPNLRELTIVNYEGERSPSWMMNTTPLELSSLKIFDCPLWKNQLLYWQMPVLTILEIHNCPNLDKLPNMPVSLVEFRLFNVGLTSLPYLATSFGYNTPQLLSLKSSLRLVEIKNCPNLISLNGFLLQENLDLQAIEKFILWTCRKLELLPVVAFGKLMSLQEFNIQDCRNLTNFPSLPLSLSILYIIHIGVSTLPDCFQSFYSTGGSSTSSLKSSLRTLEIRRCHRLMSLNEFLEQENVQFKEVEDITISSCRNLGPLPLDSFGKFVSLKHLHIDSDQNLTELPNLPLSLIKLSIFNVGSSSLPEFYPISDSINSSTLPLRSVSIYGWKKLTSLNGFMQQYNIDFQFIKTIHIQECRNLVYFPIGGFQKFVQLTELDITNCPMLVAGYNRSNLPMALKVLSIKNCGGLDMPLLESAYILTALTELRIDDNCANITHIPCPRNAFRSLRQLSINRCDKLVELSSTKQARINLQGSSLASLNVVHLNVDHLSLLLIEPLRSLRFVTALNVTYCTGMEGLPEQWLLQNSSTLRDLNIADARTLRSLLATMTSLTALYVLTIKKANFLEELPNFPPSLQFKTIKGLDGRCFP